MLQYFLNGKTYRNFKSGFLLDHLLKTHTKALLLKVYVTLNYYFLDKYAIEYLTKMIVAAPRRLVSHLYFFNTVSANKLAANLILTLCFFSFLGFLWML